MLLTTTLYYFLNHWIIMEEIPRKSYKSSVYEQRGLWMHLRSAYNEPGTEPGVFPVSFQILVITSTFYKETQRGSNLPRVHTANRPSSQDSGPVCYHQKPLLFPLHQVGSQAALYQRERVRRHCRSWEWFPSDRGHCHPWTIRQSTQAVGILWFLVSFPFSVLSVIYSQGERNLEADVYNGLSEILKKCTSTPIYLLIPLHGQCKLKTPGYNKKEHQDVTEMHSSTFSSPLMG